MPLYKLTESELAAVPQESMSKLGIRERQDLQRVLRENIEAVAPGVLVIAEEFSEWEDSRRRVDLLGIDEQGSVVVIELKRTSDGGHMDLQAIRYAAMVSALTRERIVEILAAHLRKNDREGDAEQMLLEHVDEDADVGAKTRIVLVSQDFDSEITTAVLWANEQGLDISCVRVQPYQDAECVFLDIQQIIPLPETSDYMVRMRQKADEKKVSRSFQRDFTRFVISDGDSSTEPLPKRRAILTVVTRLIKSGHTPEEIQAELKTRRRRFFRIPKVINTRDDFWGLVPDFLDENKFPKLTPPRWFTADNELLHCGGGTYAFSTQWGTGTEEAINRLLEAFPDCGLTISRA